MSHVRSWKSQLSSCQKQPINLAKDQKDVKIDIFAGTVITIAISMATVAGMYAFMDYTQSPKFLMKYKVQLQNWEQLLICPNPPKVVKKETA